MGEAKRKGLSHRKMLESSERCIYCFNAATTIEHMPPISIFDGRRRPSGLVFPSCASCNNGTKGADTTAHLFSRFNSEGSGLNFWGTPASEKLLHTLQRDAPGVREEVSPPGRQKVVWMPNRAGILEKKIQLNPTGPIFRGYLNVFSAKIAMALYAEYIGEPLPLGGMVQTAWYLNGGLTSRQAEVMLSILPAAGDLTQGKFSVRDQFAYRYNTDQKTIIAGLVGLRGNLHIFFIATKSPKAFGLPRREMLDAISTAVAEPGGLISMISGLYGK